MYRASPIAPFTPEIDRRAPSPIVRQLYAALRDAIISGTFVSGQRLLSTRLASSKWRVSRGVVAEAYDMLIAEGLASAVHGSGTFVSATARRMLNSRKKTPFGARVASTTRVSDAARALLAGNRMNGCEEQIPFALGRATRDEHSASLLTRIASRHLRFDRAHCQTPRDDDALRSAITTYLAVARGVRCSPDRVFTTSGRQEALDIITRTLVSPGHAAIVEDPCHPSIWRTLTLNGVHMVSFPVDAEILAADRLGRLPAPTALYVTPSPQYAGGETLSLARRSELVRFAHTAKCWIVENDYEGELVYEGAATTAIQGHDETGSVVYVGAVDDAFLPAFGVGYLVVPDELARAVSLVRSGMSQSRPTWHQRVLADFLDEGHYCQHVARLVERYRRSRDVLVELLRERCGEFLSVTSPECGTHLIATSTGQWRDDVAFSRFARQRGVVTVPVSAMQCIGPANTLMLGFAGLSTAEADAGTRELALAFDDYRRLCRSSIASAPPPLKARQ